MKQVDGAELLGPNVPGSSSIGLIYVDPEDNRQSVLTAILTQDKLGRKEVAVVLPENNTAFQRPVDFDGLKKVRRGLKSQIVFIAPGGPGPAEFARQRRFTVYPTLESFVQSLKVEAKTNETAAKSKRFGRKSKSADAHASPSPSDGRIEQEPISPPPVNESIADPQQAPLGPRHGEEGDVTEDSDARAGPNAALAGMAGAAAGLGLGALAGDRDDSPTLENSAEDQYATPPLETGSPKNESRSSSSATLQADEESKPASSNDTENKEDPGIIFFPAPAARPKTAGKLAAAPSKPVPFVAPVAAAKPDVPTAAPPVRRRNTGKKAAVVAGAAAAGAGAALASRTSSGSSGPPPGGSSPGGPGGPGGGSGGSGRSPRRTRQLIAILLVLLMLSLIAGIAIATPGGLGGITHILPGATTTATVTITPVSSDKKNTYVIEAVTGRPNAKVRQVQARILKASIASTQPSIVQASGSIPGIRAAGALTFLNTTSSAKTLSSVILRGASGVPITFNGPITVPAVPPSEITVTGFAVNVGAGGNIGALDINGNCCTAGIIVKNGSFGGGQDPQAHAVVVQADINAATNRLVASLRPKALSDLQQQVHANEQVVPNTLQCLNRALSDITVNHNAGDHASSVSAGGTVVCTEEVYDHDGALSMAKSLLKADVSKKLGTNYAPPLDKDIAAGVTQATVIDTKGTVSLNVSAQGLWVYQFSKTVLQGFKNTIARESEQAAMNYLLQQPGVKSVNIQISSGNTLPDAADITIKLATVPGVIGSPATTPSSHEPPVVPTAGSAPTASPITPTQGLGG